MKSFLANRTVEPEPVKAAISNAQVPAGLSALSGLQLQNPVCSDPTQDSVVTCKREGDVIRTIIVTCACGKTTEIDCHYKITTSGAPPA